MFDTNRIIIEKRIIPELGELKLRDLTPTLIQHFYNKLLKKYPTDYVKSIHSIVSKTLRRAFKWDMLGTNIMEKVDTPKLKKMEMSVRTMEQCMHFLNVSKDYPKSKPTVIM